MYPIRMNMVDIVIRQLDKTESTLDDDFGGPRGQEKFKQPMTLQGQINFGDSGSKFKESSASLIGSTEDTEGHLVFRLKDLTDAGVTLEIGDLVVTAAGIPQNLRIKELRYESPLRGSFLLLYAELERRNRSV